MHHRNLSEKGIQKAKGNFNSVLCGVYDSSPLNLQERLTPQTEIQVNLLHQANDTQKVS